MSETLLAGVLRALDVTVFEHTSDGTFRTVGTAPEWLEVALGESGTLPFIDHFLPQARAAWQDRRGARANSGAFTADVGGEDALLRATAMTVEGRSFLVIERLTGDNDTRPLLQRAREQMLAAEQLARQATGVHAPAAAIDRVAAEMAGATLDPAHQRLVDALTAANAQLQAVASTLPKPPARSRRMGGGTPKR